MKKLLIILSLLIAKIGYSQEIYQPLIDRYNAVSYIFEGKVIKTYSYLTADSKTIYTANVIEVSKIFKGNMSCGQIEMITMGGTVGDLSMTCSHCLSLGEGDMGVFLCDSTHRELPDSNFYPFTLSTVLDPTFEWQSLITYAYEVNEWKAYDLWSKFDSLQALYDFSDLATGLSYTDCSYNIFPPHHVAQPLPYRPDAMPVYNPADIAQAKTRLDYHKAHYARPKSSRSTETLNYTLSNMIVTGTNPKYLEYDVDLSDVTANHYLEMAEFRIVYDPAVFGTNVVTNNKIAVTNGSLADTNCYFIVMPQDDNANTISMGNGAHDVGICKNLLTNTPQPFVHIKMEIQTCGLNSKIDIQDTISFIAPSFMASSSAYSQSAGDTFFTRYDAVNTDSLPVPSCTAKIMSFDPDTVTGGTGGTSSNTLRINGYQFGPCCGNLYMKRADDGGITYVRIESSDILNWTDTGITIRISSIDSSTFSPIGSGQVIIETQSLDRDTSDKIVTVFYAQKNITIGAASTIKYRNFLSSHNTVNGYSFYVDTSISHNPKAYGCVTKAMHEWVCATGVNFEIIGDTFGFPLDRGADDSINIIAIGKLRSGRNASTFQITRACASSNRPVFGIDLLINNPDSLGGYQWWFDSTGTLARPQDSSDFYHTILHELGHALGLSHINDSAAIMFFRSEALGITIPPNKRRNNIKTDLSCIDGGRYIVTGSTVSSIVGPCVGPMTPLSTCFGYNAILDVGGKSEEILITPNPFDRKLWLKLNEHYSGKLGLDLFSPDGRSIYHMETYQTGDIILPFELPQSLPTGLYILVTRLGNDIHTQKLIHVQD